MNGPVNIICSGDEIHLPAVAMEEVNLSLHGQTASWSATFRWRLSRVSVTFCRSSTRSRSSSGTRGYLSLPGWSMVHPGSSLPGKFLPLHSTITRQYTARTRRSL